MPQPWIKINDLDLRRHYNEGKTPQEIADILGVVRTTVMRRIAKLQLSTQAQALQPIESKKFTDESINALGQINKSLVKVNLLMDACDEWLRDADNPTKYDVGPRSTEVDVTYTVELEIGDRFVTQKRKKKLSELLAELDGGIDPEGNRITSVEKGEYKHADPRELILKTAQEARSTIDLAADLARMLVDHRSMQVFRDAVIKAIHECDPEKGREISAAVRRTIVLHNALGGLETLSAGF